MRRQQADLITFLIPFIFTLLSYRAILTQFPKLSLFIFGVQIHHFFTGAVLLVFLVPFLIFRFSRNTRMWALMLSGFASASVLDQVVFTLFTKGSDTAYLGVMSLYGMLFFSLAFFIFLIAMLGMRKLKI